MITGMARRPAPLALALALAFLGAGTASAQIPDKFTNRQVLPKDISKAQLTATIRFYKKKIEELGKPAEEPRKP